MAHRRPVSRLIERVVGALLFHRHPVEPAALDALRAGARQLDGGDAGAFALWDDKRRELRRLLVEGDPRAFLHWDPVRTTMVKRGRRPVAVELARLRRRGDWRSRWRPALRESTLGRPRPFVRAPWTSGTLIHQAYHLACFEETTGRRLTELPFVVEFGGGYGSLCRLFHQLGFRGTYVIFDLPEVTLLQRFFLGSLHAPVVTTSDVGELRAHVAKRPSGGAAFIACASLGEAPIHVRRQVLPVVAGFDAVLIAYTAQALGVDNRTFFSDWRSEWPGYRWYDVERPHLEKAEWYLFGAAHAAERGS